MSPIFAQTDECLTEFPEEEDKWEFSDEESRLPSTVACSAHSRSSVHLTQSLSVQAVRYLLDLQAELQSIRDRLNRLEDLAHFLTMPINTLAPEPFELIKPILVLVEPVVDDEGEPCEYIASFPDGSVAATGDTVEESLNLLKDRMVNQFSRLSGMPRDQLGKILLRQLDALQAVMRRVNNDQAES